MHMTKLTDTDLCNNLIICNVTENINNSFFSLKTQKIEVPHTCILIMLNPTSQLC